MARRCIPSRRVGFRFFDVTRRCKPPRRVLFRFFDVGAAPTPTGTTTAVANDHDNEDICCRSDTRMKTRHSGRTRYARIFLFYYTYSTGRMSPFNSCLQPTPTPTTTTTTTITMPTTTKTAAAANANGDDESRQLLLMTTRGRQPAAFEQGQAYKVRS